MTIRYGIIKYYHHNNITIIITQLSYHILLSLLDGSYLFYHLDFIYHNIFIHIITIYDLLIYYWLGYLVMDGLKDTIGGEFIIALAFTFTIYLFICRCTCWLRWYRFIYLLSSGVQKFIYNRSFVYSSHPQSRNELIKLPVFEIKCKAMMGICIYWISRHVNVIFYN